MAKTRITGILFTLLFLAYGWFAQDIQLDFWAEEELFNARSFPMIVAAGGTLVSLLYTLLAWLPSRTAEPAANPFTGLNWSPVAGLLLVLFIYSYLITPLGFIVATIILLLACFLILGERRPLPLAAVSILTATGFYALMTWLGIHLEPGILSIIPGVANG